MKKVIESNLSFVLLVVLFLITSCVKEEVPVLTTTDATGITASSASSGGNITSDGNAGITAKGVCWSTTINPTISGTHTSDGGGAGVFVSSITGLNGGTTYHVRAYATNSKGTSYGSDKTFLTLGQAPVATTVAASNILTTTATLNGTVNPNYLSTTVTFEYGLTISYGSTATATQSPVTGSTATNVTANLTGLNPGALYHFRVKTVNTLGTTNGNDLTFTTLGQVPAAITLAATNPLTTTATINGTVNANLLSTTVTFEYGLTTSYGSTAAATPATVTGSTVTSVSANLISLTPGATYHFRVKAVNVLGTTNGTDMTFSTFGQAPTVVTIAATSVQGLSATLNGTVNANYLSTVVSFEYGLSTGYGTEVVANQSPVAGSTVTNVSANLSNLTPGGITYHFRVKAVNVLGTTYGDDLTFITLGQAPIVRTKIATNVLSSSATLNATTNANDLLTTVTFEYGLTTAYENSGTALQSPLSGNVTTNVSLDISGLLPSTVYNFRVKAENALGVVYGNNLIFTTGAK
jgi:hypothetical protein